jgi:hypothetical protein
MSSNLFSTVSNYSGRQPDNQQGIKQFVTTIKNQAIWIYKKYAPGELFITLADSKKNVLIKTNLIVEGSINNPSDITLKKNIKKISKENNENTLNLEPIEFIYKNDLKEQNHFGFIAQDVEKIYPNLVLNQSGYKTINYIEIIPLLVSKIKEMQEEISILKDEIKNLK